MYRFLIPLLLGFALGGASAFTAAFSRLWGERGGRMATMVLRNLLAIPLWLFGFVLAWRTAAPSPVCSRLGKHDAGLAAHRRRGDPCGLGTQFAGPAHAHAIHPGHAGPPRALCPRAPSDLRGHDLDLCRPGPA